MLVSETTTTTATPVETFLFVPEVVAVAPTPGPVEGPALSTGAVPVKSHLRPAAVSGLRLLQAQPGLNLPSPPRSGQAAPLTVRQTEVIVSIPATAPVVKPGIILNININLILIFLSHR